MPECGQQCELGASIYLIHPRYIIQETNCCHQWILRDLVELGIIEQRNLTGIGLGSTGSLTSDMKDRKRTV